MKTKIIGVLITLVVLALAASVGISMNVPFWKGYVISIVASVFITFVSALVQSFAAQMRK